MAINEPNVGRKYATRSDLFSGIKEHLKKDSERADAAINKLNTLFETLNNNAIEEAVLTDIGRAPLDRMLFDVRNWTQEELNGFVLKKYSK